MSKFLKLKNYIVGIIMILFFILYVDPVTNTKNIFTDCQPITISYNSYDPYCFYIVEINTLSQKKVKEIKVAKKIEPSYGYTIPYIESFRESQEISKNSKVVWREDGIEFISFDLKIFIPKDRFIGGR